MGGQSGRVDLDHGTSPPSVCLGRLSLGGTARSRPGPKVTRRPGPLAAERCDGDNGTRRGEPWPSPPDPADLSKRVARRRAELHLSKAQVAARAGMSMRYLEYVERYPARPGGTEMRRRA